MASALRCLGVTPGVAGITGDAGDAGWKTVRGALPGLADALVDRN